MIENILKDLRYAVATGILLAIILVLLIGNIGEYQGFSALWSWLLRWCHVVAGLDIISTMTLRELLLCYHYF